MEQNRPEPRRTLPPAQRRRRHRIRLVRNWTVFLLSCGAMMAVMTGGILWLLPKAYALIAPPTAAGRTTATRPARGPRESRRYPRAAQHLKSPPQSGGCRGDFK